MSNANPTTCDDRTPEARERANVLRDRRMLRRAVRDLDILVRDIGEEPDPSTGKKGSGIKRSVSLLLADRSFYRVLASLAALAIVAQQVIQIVKSFGK